MRLELPPGSLYSHVITRTVTVTTTNTATWTALQPTLAVMARSNLLHKAEHHPAFLAPPWRTAWLEQRGPLWTTNRSATASVYVSGPLDDQDQDGIPDNVESATDFDGDNLPNFLDTDADNDGAPDAEEGTADQDQDGQMDFVDPNNRPPVPTDIEGNPQEPLVVNKIYLPLVARE